MSIVKRFKTKKNFTILLILVNKVPGDCHKCLLEGGRLTIESNREFCAGWKIGKHFMLFLLHDKLKSTPGSSW